MEKQEQVFLLLGSNQQNPLAQLSQARVLIEAQIGALTKASKIYQTEAWGKEDQDDFLNQALEVQTELEPAQLLAVIHQIESTMGRVRQDRWGPRPIDIDILFYGNQVLDLPGLTVPHIGIPDRNFTLAPLMEIAPEFEHPVLLKNMETLYWESRDPLEVILLEE
ncbi:MAG: 2-amino-4-hydroxy-6-hydroxymethyldihydropteridine diphosphokinase [Saprospiraceae bacterium]|nr:2-amino-4-hydroxy-6-hydroxymethyldihydropteridine diphosphokinase [Saprospiraceae bacterium]